MATFHAETLEDLTETLMSKYSFAKNFVTSHAQKWQK